MIEYHGFIIIRESYQESMDNNNNNTLLNDIIHTLNHKIETYNQEYQNTDIILNRKNGTHQLSVFGSGNHLNQDWLIFINC